MRLRPYLAAVNVISMVVIALYAFALVNMAIQGFDVYAKLPPLLLSVLCVPFQFFCALLPAALGFPLAASGERRERVKTLILSGIIAGEVTAIALLPSHGSSC